MPGNDRVLLVEGPDDKHVVRHLSNRHKEMPEFCILDKEGIENLLENIGLENYWFPVARPSAFSWTRTTILTPGGVPWPAGFERRISRRLAALNQAIQLWMAPLASVSG